jgi:hypothetical protein
MKKVVICTAILLVLLSNSSTCCSNNFYSYLQGKWRYINEDEIESESNSVILFHKSGRYVIFNDPRPYDIPIIEKGDWNIKNKKLVLKRDFGEEHSSNGFRYVDVKDSILEFFVQISDKKLSLGLGGKKPYTNNYRKVTDFPKMVYIYSGYGSDTHKIALPSSGARTLLKLSYKTPWVDPKEPIGLVIVDQDGHELWRKDLKLTEDVQKEEILLADKPEIINLTELVVMVHAGKSSPWWDIQIKLY